MELRTPPAFILRSLTSGPGSLLNQYQGFFYLVVPSWGFTLAHGAGLEFFPLSSSCFEVHFLALRFKELRWRQSSKNLCFRFFAKIAEKGRRAWSANTCLSTTTRPQTVNWSDDVNSLTMQGIVDIEARNGTKSLEMQCFPLFTLLLALGSPTVDFLSLDIEVF